MVKTEHMYIKECFIILSLEKYEKKVEKFKIVKIFKKIILSIVLHETLK